MSYTDGSDYDGVSTTLTFGPGNLMQCVQINITDDSCVEPDQSFAVTLSYLQNSPSSVTLGTNINANVTIADDGECRKSILYSYFVHVLVHYDITVLLQTWLQSILSRWHTQ